MPRHVIKWRARKAKFSLNNSAIVQYIERLNLSAFTVTDDGISLISVKSEKEFYIIIEAPGNYIIPPQQK